MVTHRLLAARSPGSSPGGTTKIDNILSMNIALWCNWLNTSVFGAEESRFESWWGNKILGCISVGRLHALGV